MSEQFEKICRGVVDANTSIWRYLTFPKFVSLVTTQALWFSKLQVLEDTLEGTAPENARAQMKAQFRKMEDWFSDEERKQQVRKFVEVNEDDGRELIVANCWFMGDHETQSMWDNYARDSEGVVIRSTAQALANSLIVSHKHWWLGKVAYIDFKKHDQMTIYEAHQACVRAFYKSDSYAGEQELRAHP